MMIEKSSGLGFRDRSSFLAYWFPMREKAVTGHNTWRTLRGWADGQFLPVLPAFFDPNLKQAGEEIHRLGLGSRDLPPVHQGLPKDFGRLSICAFSWSERV